MRYHLTIIFTMLNVLVLQAQALDSLLIREPDDKYLEDQFYIGISYNALLNRPTNVDQSSLPYGLQLGFIKDVPLNARRNIGFGIGVGYSVNSFYSNLRAVKSGEEIYYERIPDSIDFKRNKIEAHMIDVPIEFRWRTSKAGTHSFWRIYSGIKLGYNFANRSRYIDADNRLSFTNPDIRKLQYGAYLSFGYNTWNFYVQYQLNDLIENRETITGEPIDMRVLQLGLIFYIL